MHMHVYIVLLINVMFQDSMFHLKLEFFKGY